MSHSQFPSIDYIRQCLRYEDGKLFWLRRPLEHFTTHRTWKSWNVKHSGKEAGGIGPGGGGSWKPYFTWRLRINGISYHRSNIVWLIHNGEWKSWIDHKDRNSLNDQIGNLRLSTPSQNCANSTLYSNNTSKYKGVDWHKKSSKWRSRIQVRSRSILLGYFDDPAKAHETYVAAANEHFGEFACKG